MAVYVARKVEHEPPLLGERKGASVPLTAVRLLDEKFISILKSKPETYRRRKFFHMLSSMNF
jgi:hypothetical protein